MNSSNAKAKPSFSIFVSDRENDAADLRRTFLFDHNRALASLRDRSFEVGSSQVLGTTAMVEPLLRKGEDGPEVPIRLRTDLDLDTVRVEMGGRTHEVEAQRVTDGYRLFVPEPEREVEADIELPGLGEPLKLAVSPVRRWEISLAHHSHFDIGYTDLQGRVVAEQLAYLDHALELAQKHEGSDAAHAFRWTIESVWVLREWIRRRPPANVERMVALIRSGRIEVAALPFNMHTEACSTQELHGLMRYAAELEEEYGFHPRVAYQTDVPGCVAGLVDALSDAGVPYLTVAHNWAGKSVPYLIGGANLPRAFWWQSPAGNRVLVWMTTTTQGLAYQEGAYLGFTESYDKVDDLLPLFLHSEEKRGFAFGEESFGFALGSDPDDFGRSPYPFDLMQLRVMGRVGDNCPPNERLPEIVEEWNSRWLYPQIRIENTEQYFADFEKRFGEELEVFMGDWNDWWGDGIGTAPRHMQMNRDAQAILPQVETAHGILHNVMAPGFEERLNQAWENVDLFDEHTWGAADPWTAGDVGMQTGREQWTWKGAKAIAAHDDAELLLQEVITAAPTKSAGADGTISISVVNTESNRRGGPVRFFLPESLVDTRDGIKIFAPDGQPVLFAEQNQVNAVHRSAGRFVEFLANPVDGISLADYHVEVIPGGRDADFKGTVAVERAREAVWTLENDHVCVQVDPISGAITSIINKADSRQMVDAESPFGFNAYVHDKYAMKGEVNHQSSFTTDFGPALTLLSSRTTTRHAAFEDAGQDDVCSWIRFRVQCTGVEHVSTTLTLGHSATHLDIANRVVKEGTSNKESGYFAFPFAADEPTVRYEVSGAVAGDGLASVPGGAHYMHAIRDWVLVTEAGRGFALVPQDAPLVQIGDIALPYPPFPGTTPERRPGTVFSWVYNNIWDTNFQGALPLDMDFRFRVGFVDADDVEMAGVAASQLAADKVRPLMGFVGSTQTDSERAPLVSISNPLVKLLSLQRNEETLRVLLQSLAEDEISVTIDFGEVVGNCRHTSLAGRHIAELEMQGQRSVTVPVGALGTTCIEVSLRG